MQIFNSKQTFGLITIILHWLMAVLIVGLFILGKLMVDLDYYDVNYHIFPWWHKSFGLFIGFLLIIRLIWRLLNPKVVSIQSHTPIDIKASKIIQTLLYLLILVCCISGIMISTADGAPISIFDLFDFPAFITKGQAQSDFAGEIHEVTTFSLIIFATLHMLAALKHHFIQKNDTLKRMLYIHRNKP